MDHDTTFLVPWQSLGAISPPLPHLLGDFAGDSCEASLHGGEISLYAHVPPYT